MKQLIKAARIYRLSLPADIEKHLAERKHVELSASDPFGAGFVAVPGFSDLAVTFDGGFAFTVRYDEKVVPSAVVKAELKKRIQETEDREVRKVGRKESREIRDFVVNDLVRSAFVKQTTITCFYVNDLLIVPTTSKKLANIVTAVLLQAVGAIKVTTIYVTTAKGNLTTRLADWLDGNDSAFGQFDVGGRATLHTGQRKVAVDLLTLSDLSDGLREALGFGAWVSEVGLSFGDTSFRLSHDFALRGISLADDGDGAEDTDPQWQWRQDAAIQAKRTLAVVDALCVLLDYKAEE